MGVATILEAREIAILATGEHKAAIVRRAVEGDGGPRGGRHLSAAPPEHDLLPRYAPRPPSSPGSPRRGWWTRWSGRRSWRCGPSSGSRSRPARRILKLTQGDYAEHQLSSLVARHGSPGAVNGLVFNALGAKIRGQLEAAGGAPRAGLFPAPRRRRDLDGRHPAQAGAERERDHRGLHDERQHRRLRPRRAALRGLPGAAGAGAWNRHGGRTGLRRVGAGVPGHQGAGDGGQRRHPGPEADHPRGRGGERARDDRTRPGSRPVPQPPVLPDRQGAEGPDRPRRRGDRPCPPRGGTTRS